MFSLVTLTNIALKFEGPQFVTLNYKLLAVFLSFGNRNSFNILSVGCLVLNNILFRELYYCICLNNYSYLEGVSDSLHQRYLIRKMQYLENIEIAIVSGNGFIMD